MESVQKEASPAAENQQKLVDVAVPDDNAAFNLIVSFVSLAQKRGAFNIQESSKLWECISRFQRPGDN
jgi:hypothetical protein